MSNIKFTLIHGTFSANAEWVNEGINENPNGFRARLRKRFSDSIDFSIPPAWGSRGFLKLKDLTNAARLNGANNLAEHVLNQTDKGKHFIVAHSHGGNVAMYALQNTLVAEKIDGLICLATPFLYPRKRPLSITALLLSLAIMLVGILRYIGTANLMEQGWAAWLGAAGLLVFGFIVPACLTWLVVYERYLAKIKSNLRLQVLIDNLSYQDPNIPILLVRTIGDEATGLLRGAQFLNWLGGIGMKLGGRQIYLLICAAALTLAWMAYQGAGMVPDFIVPLLGNGLTASAAVMVVLLMALTVSRIFVGFDSWRWVGEIETMVEDGPPGITSELVVIKPKKGPKLSHTSIYSEDETIEAIHKWCNSILSK